MHLKTGNFILQTNGYMIDFATENKQQGELQSCARCGFLTYDEEARCDKCKDLEQFWGGQSFMF